MQFKSFMEALKGKQHKIDKNKNGQIDDHDFKLLRKEETEELEEALDPSEIAGNPKMYDAATVKKAYYHNKTTPEDKKTLERHLDRHHGMRDWRKLEEATVKTQKYSWGTMKTVHHGSDFSIPLHPEHHEAIANLKDQQEHKFKDETGRHWTAKKSGEDVHFQSANNGPKTTVKHNDLKESDDRMARADYKTSPSGRKSHKEIVFNSGEETEKKDKMKVDESKKEDPPFDGPYTKTAPVKNSDGTMQSPMSRARELAKKAIAASNKKTNEEVESIDELSTNTLNSYKDKVYKDYRDGKPGNSSMNRITGVRKANKRILNRESKDEQEYGYEGDMAMNQLSTLIRCAEMIKETLKPDTDLPEWVQSKITLASDYIVTAADYLHSELEEQAPVAPVPDRKYIKGTPENKALKASRKPINGMPTNVKEEAESIDELSKGTLGNYVKKASRDATITRKIGADFENRADRARSPGMKDSNTELSSKYKQKSWKRRDGLEKAVDRLTKEEVEQIDEANHREFASQGLMHPDMAKHMKTGQEMDFYHSKTGDKISGVVKHNTNGEVHIKANKDGKLGAGEVHKFKVSSNLKEFKTLSYSDFISNLLEYTPGPGGVTQVKGRSYGASYVDPEGEDDYDDKKPVKVTPEKRGRGRPAGAQSGARKNFGNSKLHTK